MTNKEREQLAMPLKKWLEQATPAQLEAYKKGITSLLEKYGFNKVGHKA